ncbi:MAG: hypothetical protein FWG57_01270, partial [Endomicrobia bacterium]|nr:hypothetical protein [Endomicrobiia bacterium]
VAAKRQYIISVATSCAEGVHHSLELIMSLYCFLIQRKGNDNIILTFHKNAFYIIITIITY